MWMGDVVYWAITGAKMFHALILCKHLGTIYIFHKGTVICSKFIVCVKAELCFCILHVNKQHISIYVSDVCVHQGHFCV